MGSAVQLLYWWRAWPFVGRFHDNDRTQYHSMSKDHDLPAGPVLGIAILGILGSLLILARIVPLILGREGTRVRCSLLVWISSFELVLSLCNCISAFHALVVGDDSDICSWVALPLTFS